MTTSARRRTWTTSNSAETGEAPRTWTPHAKGVYVTLNPVDPELLSLRRNRVEKYAQRTANDGDIIRRRLFLVDVDPYRFSAATGQRITAEISATDAEKAGAR